MAKGAATVATPTTPTLSDEERLADRKKYLQRTQGLLKDTLFSTNNNNQTNNQPTEKTPQGLLGVYG